MNRTLSLMLAVGLVVTLLGVGHAAAQDKKPMDPKPAKPKAVDPGPAKAKGMEAMSGKIKLGDPVGEYAFPPELVIKAGEEIGLAEEQKQALRAEMQKAGARFAELQPGLQREMEALGSLLKEARPDEAKVLEQLEKVLDAERGIKRVQLGLVVAIKNLLTTEQQAQLQELKQKLAASKGGWPVKGAPASLQAKMQQVQERVGEWKRAGRDLAPVGQALREFEPLAREGKFAEAEAVADRALEVLGQEPRK